MDERNFLALRVFPNKYKEMATHHGLQQEALDGYRLMTPSEYKTYLPKFTPIKKSKTKGVTFGDNRIMPVGTKPGPDGTKDVPKVKEKDTKCCVIF